MLKFLSLKLKRTKTKMAKLKLKIPVKKGDRLELEVETLASSGDGLCHYKGYTLFIPNGLPGDRVHGNVI